MNRDEIILAGKEFLFPAVFHYFEEPLVIAKGKDQYVWDADGKQYLDFFGVTKGSPRRFMSKSTSWCMSRRCTRPSRKWRWRGRSPR